MYIQCVGCGQIFNVSRSQFGYYMRNLFDFGCPICGARIFISDESEDVYLPPVYFDLIYRNLKGKICLEYIVGYAGETEYLELDKLKKKSCKN